MKIPTPYQAGELRLRRSMTVDPTSQFAYIVEENKAPFKKLTNVLLSEECALYLMRSLGSAYPGPRYPDNFPKKKDLGE